MGVKARSSCLPNLIKDKAQLDLRTCKRDLLTRKRDLLIRKRDLAIRKRDLLVRKRDLRESATTT